MLVEEEKRKYADFLLRIIKFHNIPVKNYPHKSLNISKGVVWSKELMLCIGFTLLYFKMAIMPLVLETKMADVGKLISLRNLLATKTMWLVLTTTSATSILSRIFGAYSHLSTLILFPLWLPERTLLLSPFQLTVNTLFLFFTFDFKQSTSMKMHTLCNYSLPCYTFLVRLFPASNTEISSNHWKKQTTNMGGDAFLLTYIIKIL